MSASARVLPDSSDFEVDLRRFVNRYIVLWQGASNQFPWLGKTFTPGIQASNELETRRVADSLEEELRDYPDTPEQQPLWRERVFSSLRRMGTGCFAFPDSHFDIIFSDEYINVTRSFTRQAAEFDRSISTEALAQALRNVWVMNCLQMFLGRKPSISPSIFAYSMLYPSTDNHLDQPSLPSAAKEETCHRLGRRLSGLAVVPCDAHEESVFRLIGMIEKEYPRWEFPEVYESLLAIHAGQVKSLCQQARDRVPDESSLLQISVEKGGSSVLADGWLVAGRLNHEEAEFFFGFGVLLQLLDDLQDLAEDRRAGHWTLFSRCAMSAPLDGLTSRLGNFLNTVLRSGTAFRTSGGEELRDLICRNSTMLMLRAMAQNLDFYDPEYMSRMEQFSPLRFSFLREFQLAVEERFRKVWPAVSRKRNLRSIFDLLG